MSAPRGQHSARLLPSSPDLEHQDNRLPSPDSPPHPSERLDYEDTDYSDDSSGQRLTPRFMEEEGAGKRWKWIPYPVRRLTRKVVGWVKGPEPAKIFKIDPFLPVVQHAPIRLLDRVLPKRKHRIALFLAYIAAWIFTFALVLWRSETAAEIDGWGEATDISCGVTYWSRNNLCGLDGVDCRPFDNSSFAFRCPGSCDSYHVLNPRAVGTQEIVYDTYVIGGPPDNSSNLNSVYRGDSFICTAAIHAGIISAAKGGCGVVSLIGQQDTFVGSIRNGIKSIGFDSYFPLTYTFLPNIECEATDARWNLLAISVVFTGLLSLFTTSSAAFFFGTFIIAFWQVGLASDPPLTDTVPSVFSNVLGKFLPAMFVAWVLYDKMGVRRTLRGLTAQVEKTVLWLGACWTGALTNYTLDFIPIQRLTGHDLEQQPGAKAALAIIVIVLVVVVVGQIWCFQREARLVRYLTLYALFILAIIIAVALPSLNLRIHHYILALLLLPGTSIQTRPSLLYQGLLVGLFINGIARWGFDAVLQTSSALQGDAQLGTDLPVILAPAINTTLSQIAFQWQSAPDIRYDGISVLVNDVERYRAYFGDKGSEEFVWSRENGSSINEYFRFGYTQGADSGDYTKAATWDTDMEWIEMASGPSRLKGRDIAQTEHHVPRSLHVCNHR